MTTSSAAAWPKTLLLGMVLLTQVPVGFAQQEPVAFSTEELLGQFEPSRHPDFVRVPAAYTNRPDSWLRRETVAAFVRMAEAAAKDGVRLTVISATRNFKRQREIWERKWRERSGADTAIARDILRWSSMPGTSRHHWGTDFDLNSLEPAYFESGEGARVYAWLCTHAHEYGFYQPYDQPGEERQTGYQEEKWHWSYYPLASRYLMAYEWLVEQEDLPDFKGAYTAKEIEMFRKWVEGVRRSPRCLP